MESAKNAIVLVFDGLGAGLLGPYGNTWLDTPGMNRLAAQSLVLEHTLVDSPQLADVYRSWWFGLHALCPPAACQPQRELARVLYDHGVLSTLLTDEAELIEHAGADRFSQHILLPTKEVIAAAAEPEQTQLAALTGAVVDWIDRAGEPFLLWVHARALTGPWDAPQAFRERLTDTDDPPPEPFVDPPAAADDADQLLGVVNACAAQVELIDMCVAALLDGLDAGRHADNTLLALTSSRGYPLGEHGQVGLAEPRLYNELVHVPWMLSLPAGAAALLRSHRLVQPHDLYATLLDWFGAAPPAGTSLLPLIAGEQLPGGDRAVAVCDAQRLIRTPAWQMRQPAADAPAKLFVKPDDRHDANDVAVRCADIVTRLRDCLAEYDQAVQADDFAALPALDDVLVEGLE